MCSHRAGRQPSQHRVHTLLAVVEPVLDILLEGVPSVLHPESEELALADSGRTNRREVVAMPLFGNSNSGHAHARDVVDVAMVALHSHRRKDEGSFLVHVAGGSHVGGGHGIADIGLMCFREYRKAVDTVVIDHRDEDGKVGGVRATVVRRVVKKRITSPQIRMKLDHRAGHRIGADHDVDGQAFSDRKQSRVAGQHAT